MNRTEQWTLALAALYLTMLAIVYVLEDPVGWLLWAIGMVIVSGAVLVAFNRSAPVANDESVDRDRE